MIMKKVNKILVNSNIDINNSINDLNTKDSKINLNVYGESTLYIVNQNIENLVINMKDNSKLDIYIYNVCKLKYIEINQTSNSSINFNYSYVNEGDNYLEVVNNIEDDTDYKKLLSKYNTLDNEAYIIDNYIVVNLSRVSDKYLRTLILFNKDNEKVDEYNVKNIIGYDNNILEYNDGLFMYEINNSVINKYKLNIIDDSFNKELLIDGSVMDEQ